MHQIKEIEELSKIKPIISVVICTYNRADYLKKCLDSMQDQTYNNFEVIVVNGPSTDETKNLLKKYPFKVFQQKEKSGLSAARNLGIKSAKGDIIAFIDDDGIADKNWLDELTKGYTNEDTVSVGGKIMPIWLSEKPKWYIDQLDSYLSLLDLGENSKQMFFPDCLFGCNMSFRKRIFNEVGYFDVSLGRYLSKNLLSHDEIDLYKRIDEKSYKTMYNPKAVVYHQIDSSRLTKTWFKERFYWNGISSAIFNKKYSSKTYVFKSGIKKLFFTVPYNLVLYSFDRIKKRKDKAFIRKMYILRNFGYLIESLGLNFGRAT